VNKEWMPITITLEELQQHSVIATVNRVIPPFTIGHAVLPAEIIRNDDTMLRNEDRGTYIINSGGCIIDGQLVESSIKESQGGVHEYVRISVENKTDKKRFIKKGDLLATAEIMSQAQINTLSNWDENKMALNEARLIASIVECWNINTANSATQGPTLLSGVDSIAGEFASHEGKGRSMPVFKGVEDLSLKNVETPTCEAQQSHQDNKIAKAEAKEEVVPVFKGHTQLEIPVGKLGVPVFKGPQLPANSQREREVPVFKGLDQPNDTLCKLSPNLMNNLSSGLVCASEGVSFSHTEGVSNAIKDTPLLGEIREGVISNQTLIQQLDVSEADERNILDDDETVSVNNYIDQAIIADKSPKLINNT
jgi:hypothetical protein